MRRCFWAFWEDDILGFIRILHKGEKIGVVHEHYVYHRHYLREGAMSFDHSLDDGAQEIGNKDNPRLGLNRIDAVTIEEMERKILL